MAEDTASPSKPLTWIFWAVTALVVLARIVRIAWPEVQIEDPNYIYGAFLITLGKQPFWDFAQPNPPLLESILSIFYLIFGVSHRIPEIFTAAATTLTAIFMIRLSTRWFSRAAGYWAAGLYGLHFLVFRYHLFEREIFATLAVLAGLDLLFSASPSRFKPFAAGAVIAVGYACKQTALIPFLAILMVMILFQREWSIAFKAIVGFLFCLGVFTGLYSALYGIHYIRQTFLFHFIKGTVAPWYVKALWSAWGLGYLVPLLLAALILLPTNRKAPEWILWAMTAADLVFFWWVSGAFWPHYLLSTMVPIAMLGGSAMDQVIAAIYHRKSTIRLVAATLVPLALTLILLLVNPAFLTGYGAAQHYGFSGTPRIHTAQAAEFIRTHTAPDSLIISDPFIALEAHREKVVKFKDNWGLILWMNQLLDQGRYRQELQRMSHATFAEIRQTSQRYWMSMIDQALQEKRVSAIQPNYELPLDPEFLTKIGFRIGVENPSYSIWIKP